MMTDEVQGADDEMASIKEKLANAMEELEAVGEDLESTLTHEGRVIRERLLELWTEIDEHLERAQQRIVVRLDSASAEEAVDFKEFVDHLHALREDIEVHLSRTGEDASKEETLGIISEFHARVDEHLEWMRRTGHEW
jgi:ElaB/YqjD/DUF883 family membrane-anchored ribosome-binding protein